MLESGFPDLGGDIQREAIISPHFDVTDRGEHISRGWGLVGWGAVMIAKLKVEIGVFLHNLSLERYVWESDYPTIYIHVA